MTGLGGGGDLPWATAGGGLALVCGGGGECFPAGGGECSCGGIL